MALRLDVEKANPNLTFELPIRLDGDFVEYDGVITAVVKHLTAETQEKCFTTDNDGNRTISPVAIFKWHCKELHGLTHLENGEEVEYTPQEILRLSKGAVKVNGQYAGGLIDIIIAQVATAALDRNMLNGDEVKN